MSGQDMIALAVVIVILGISLFLYLMGRRKKNEKDSTVKPPAQSALAPVMESPKVAAMRGATRQSLLLNMAAIQSFQQMSEVARKCQSDTTARQYPQGNPQYRQSEWLNEYNNPY